MPWLIVAILGLFYLVGLPLVIFQVILLRRRVRDLEQRLALRGPLAAPLPASPGPASAGSPGTVARPPRADAGGLETLVGARGLTWVGVLAIFFGTAYFVALDLTGSPLSGVVQVLVELAVALLFVLAGRWFSGRAGRFLGLSLLGGGLALLDLGAYGAYGFHHLIGAATVYPFLAAIAVLGALLALRQNAAVIAALTLAGALLAPLILSVRGDPAAALFPYLAAVNLGTVLVGRRTGWAGLPLAAFSGSAILLVAWADAHYGPEQRLALLSVASWLWLLYAITPLLGEAEPGFWSVARGIVVLVDGLAFAGTLWFLLGPELTGLRGATLAGLSLIYVASEHLARRHLPASLGLELTRVAGVAIAALAVPAQLDRGWVTLGWTVLAAVLFWTDRRGTSAWYLPLACGAVLLALGKTVTVDTAALFAGSDRPDAVMNGGFLAGLAIVALMLLVCVVYGRRPRDARDRTLSTLVLVVALVLLLWKITFEMALYFDIRHDVMGTDQNKRLLLSWSLVWALYAFAVTACGLIWRRAALRTLGLVFAGMLVVKVFLIDLQALERGYRIASLVGVGVLMLVVSMLFQRRRGSA